MRRTRICRLAVLTAALWVAPVLGQYGATKHSPLDQITAENFAELEIAWHWKTADAHLTGSADGGPSLLPSDRVFDLLPEEKPEQWANWDGVNQSASKVTADSLDLPTGAPGSAMTYMLDGIQHLALTVGGKASSLIAFREVQ